VIAGARERDERLVEEGQASPEDGREAIVRDRLPGPPQVGDDGLVSLSYLQVEGEELD